MGDTFDVPSYQHGMGSHLRDTLKSIHILKAHDIGYPGGANTKNTSTKTKTDSETERPKVCYLFGKWMTQGL